MSVIARPGCSVPLWLEFPKFCPKNMMLNSYFLRNVSQFISTINENNPSIRILGFGYLDIDTIQLSNVWIHGQLDISILYVSGYLDTWILGYHGYLDTWIFGYFNFFSIRIMDSKKSLDIQVSGYPSIRKLIPRQCLPRKKSDLKKYGVKKETYLCYLHIFRACY